MCLGFTALFGALFSKTWRVHILFRDYKFKKTVCEPRHEKTCFMPYANNKGAVQPAHLRSVISAFVVRCLDIIILLVSISEISSLSLVSTSEQAGLGLTWFATPEDRFSRHVAHVTFLLLLRPVISSILANSRMTFHILHTKLIQMYGWTGSFYVKGVLDIQSNSILFI